MVTCGQDVQSSRSGRLDCNGASSPLALNGGHHRQQHLSLHRLSFLIPGAQAEAAVLCLKSRNSGLGRPIDRASEFFQR